MLNNFCPRVYIDAYFVLEHSDVSVTNMRYTLLKRVFLVCFVFFRTGELILFYYLFCCLMSQSTTMIMSRWSVNLDKLFLGRLKTKAVSQYLMHILSPVSAQLE